MIGKSIRRVIRTLILSALVTVWAFPVSAQTTLSWEMYGDLIIDGRSAPAFDYDKSLIYGGISNNVNNTQNIAGVFKIALPIFEFSEWEVVQDANEGARVEENLFFVGSDTLLASGGGIGFFRSLDGGDSWTRIDTLPNNPYPSVSQWLEIPPGVPRAGRILGAAGNNMAIYSDDRGASFEKADRLGRPPDSRADRLTVVTAGPNAGRILGAGLNGITKSDDGGHTWTATPEWAYFAMSTDCVGVLRGQGPGGGDRVVTVLNDVRILDDSIRVSVSDDGGDTWRRTDAVLPGDFRTCVEVVDLGGGRAVAVMLRGPVYGTEDAGETWTQWSAWPGGTDPLGRVAFANWAVLGPDGHLYLGLSHNSAPNVYDVRTTVPVGMITLREAPPSSVAGLSLSVRPNPSDGRVMVEIVAEASEAVRVSVLDALGREVAVVYEGAVSNRLALPVETAGLSPGVYVVRAELAGRAGATARFTVAR